LNITTGTFNWGWMNDNKYLTINGSGNYISLSETSELTSIPVDNYGILKCEYIPAEDEMPLTAYLPIPIKKKGYSHIEGAREVIYNH
jgi:hypothetical protein